jgi:hypothetical protein
MSTPSSPPQQQRRKRLSLHHTLSARDSGIDSSTSAQASPLQTSRISNIMNDDAAEKASRRKSAHFGDLSVGRKEKDGEGEKDKEKGKRVASGAMAVQNSLNNSLTRDKVRKRLSAVGAGLPAPVALEVNSTKFEEWMKLATDNVGRLKSGSEADGLTGRKSPLRIHGTLL